MMLHDFERNEQTAVTYAWKENKYCPDFIKEYLE